MLFEINSPGGSAVASEEIANAVKKANKTTVAWIREIGTSGAYWVASSSGHIVANRVSITGSIGVIASYLEFPGLLEHYNITYQRLVSGKYKDIGSPFKEMTPEEKAIFQQNLDTIRDYFVSEVAKNREMSKKDVDKIANGVFYLGAQAKELGLIDELGGKDEAINYIEKKDGIKAEINKSYGDKYLQIRKYKNKNESAQEAHEAIRPTYMENHTDNDPELARLYELIWKRTIASQMSDAELEKTTAKIAISTNNEELSASGEVIKFDGFLKVYMESSDDEDAEAAEGESRLPTLSIGQLLDFKQMTATERFTKHAARYTEASLVKKMEELGIGRPSTYAPTISTIIKRTYVEKKDKEGVKRNFRVLKLKDDQIQKITEQENTGAEKSKLFPTDLGLVVTDFLSQHFTQVMDYAFTANIEKEFDEIAEGKIIWNKMVGNFYTPFHTGVEHTLETAERAVGERVLGVGEAGKPIIARMGRYGPMVQIGAQGDEEKPRFAKLKATQSIETITLDEALELFKLPLTLGEYEGLEVAVNVGRFGPYVKWGEQFISIPKGEELSEVDLNRAVEIITAKQIEDAPIGFYDEKPITKGKGRFGPFIKWNELFINIPRAYNFDTLTQQDCNELIEKKVEKEANRFIQQWPAEKISIENGRWGPFIKFNKKMMKLLSNGSKGKYTPEELAVIDLEEIKKMIVTQDPKAFDKKGGTKKAASKTVTKKTAPKKAAKKK
ncbi:MAG: signal peptide peptidase SppA [Sphingobacteriales bacterium]|nr:signal peptide peptidase SppA [Sphingobacteriales bacterium]